MIDFFLLLFLICLAISSILMRDLLNSIILLGAYSLIMAIEWTVLNAVDVAFTEASVGAGITTVMLIAALSRVKRDEKINIQGTRFQFSRFIPLLVVFFTMILLIYGTMDMPFYGDPNAPSQTYLAPDYIERSEHETGSPNIVTAILASYRGYDTLGETTVIFTAGVCLILLLRVFKNNER